MFSKDEQKEDQEDSKVRMSKVVFQETLEEFSYLKSILISHLFEQISTLVFLVKCFVNMYNDFPVHFSLLL